MPALPRFLTQWLETAHQPPGATHHSLIVQYRLSGWGGPEDLKKRHRLEGVLGACLRRARNGHCDGGDIGSGSINIYLEEITDPQRACKTLVAELRESGDLEGAVIALNLDPDGTKEEGPYYSVLWPKDYHGEFFIL